MKTIVEATKPIGGDGGTASGGFYLENGMIKGKLELAYPVAKVVEAVTKPLDPLKEKLKALIPGNWDDPFVDKAFQEGKDEIIKLLTE